MNIDKIKKIMAEQHITAADLARLTRRSRSVITRVLNGEHKDIRISLAKDIAKALNVTIDEIVE